MKVLIADDDPVSRRLLERYLQQWNYEVSVASDGLQAWDKLQNEEFAMVICDWMMPGMDGPELIRHIREHSKYGYIYTIMLTAKSQKGDFVTGMQSGADDFVSKPYDHDELHARLRAGERIVNLERSLRAAQEVLQRDRL